MSTKSKSRTRKPTKRTTKRATKTPKPATQPERNDYSAAVLSAVIKDEVELARSSLAVLMATQKPALEIERNAGLAVFVPQEVAKIAHALQVIDASASFVRCLGVRS